MGDIRHLWTFTYHLYYIARAVFLLRFSVANRRMRLYFFSVLSTHHIISVSLSLLIMIIMWTVHFYLLMYELCLCPVWNNLHGVWAHCAAAKTSDGNKFKNATSARKDHIGVSILLQLKLRNTPYTFFLFLSANKISFSGEVNHFFRRS